MGARHKVRRNNDSGLIVMTVTFVRKAVWVCGYLEGRSSTYEGTVHAKTVTGRKK